MRELTLLLTELFNKQGDHEDTTIKRTNIKIKKPSITFLGCCFPGWIEEELASAALRSGFLGRMLVVSANCKRHLNDDPKLTDKDMQLRQQLLNDLEIVGALYGEMKFSVAAKTMWHNWYHTLPTDFSQMSDNIEVEGFVARKAQFVQRLSMLSSISRGNSLEVHTEDILYARKLVDECEACSRGLGLKSPDFQVMERLKLVLVNMAKRRNTNELPIKDIMDRVSRYLNKRQLEEKVEQLILEDFVSYENRKLKLKVNYLEWKGEV